MAEPDEIKSSPFDFSRVPGNDTFGALKSQWDGFLAQPGAQTAMLQFMINAAQPPHFGDTPASQMARAFGAAGEAVTGQMEAQRRERESEAKSQLAEARAEAAGARATGAEDRVRIADERTQIMRERAAYGAARDLQRGYSSYVEGERKRYKDAVTAWKARNDEAM